MVGHDQSLSFRMRALSPLRGEGWVRGRRSAMSDRFIHRRGGGVSFVVELAPPDGASTIRYFGADLGENADLDSLFAAEPIEKWGARLDEPRRPSTMPGRVNATPDRGDLDENGVTWIHAPVTFAVQPWLTRVRIVEGDWCNEFRISEIDDPVGLIYASHRGRHGHDRYPAIIFAGPNTSEQSGEAIAVVLAWSGSFEMRAERTRSGQLLFKIQVADEAPEADRGIEVASSVLKVVFAHSATGLSGLSQKLHRFCPAPRRRTPRLVHLNTWEAIYFHHTEETLFDLASRAASLGVERFVLDDGWFKGRNDDTSSLGDWTADEKKYPNGLAPLIVKVRNLGMEFGLWVEPEMVNRNSDLYRSHPHWVLRRNGREPRLMRNQLPLDLSNSEVTDYLFASLDALLTQNPISYLKWDMNWDLTDDPHADDNEEAQRGYVRALYDLIDRLREKHPTLEIETCASGGGRCDYGILQHTDRVWVSDSNDALDRLRINRGASLFLPPRIMGTHVGPEVCHTTGRRLSLDLRAHVAMFGHFGLELDVRQLSEKETARLKTHIDTYKRFRSLIHEGRYWRIQSHEPDHLVDAVTSDERDEALLRVVRVDSKRLGQGTTAFIPGLDLDRTYALTAIPPVSSSVDSGLAPALRQGTLRLTGRMLAAAGLSLYLPRPETSLLIHLKA